MTNTIESVSFCLSHWLINHPTLEGTSSHLFHHVPGGKVKQSSYMVESARATKLPVATRVYSVKSFGISLAVTHKTNLLSALKFFTNTLS